MVSPQGAAPTAAIEALRLHRLAKERGHNLKTVAKAPGDTASDEPGPSNLAATTPVTSSATHSSIFAPALDMLDAMHDAAVVELQQRIRAKDEELAEKNALLATLRSEVHELKRKNERLWEERCKAELRLADLLLDNLEALEKREDAVREEEELLDAALDAIERSKATILDLRKRHRDSVPVDDPSNPPKRIKSNNAQDGTNSRRGVRVSRMR
ncbi:hypothetical protein HMN09_00814500 [Mycena chlorophos]|uniref:Uncharacterized protein n=1 Tax=Mycena chlorophos TaxID=658473 RepID=A0A8H6W5H4_MYCCL|nr:hypothetical protein HMN09_00814500 [Mycena chlorophos]